MKSWGEVLQHSSSGRQQERVLVATDAAFYRCNYSFRDGAVKEVRRVAWEQLAAVQCGAFAYRGSDGGWADGVLSREVTGQYGLRLLHRRPGAALLAASFWHAAAAFWNESVVDNGVCLTFSPLVPPLIEAAGPEAAARFQRDTVAELALVCWACMLHVQRDSPAALAETRCGAVAALEYRAGAPVLAALHRSLGYGREREARASGHAPLGPPPQIPPPPLPPPPEAQPDVSPWETPGAGELPRTRLSTRRCF